VFSALAATSHVETSPDEVRDRVRHLDEVRAALERMWPVLTPSDFLHDLFGSRALLRLAASKWLTEAEWSGLYRSRDTNGSQRAWSEADAALLDEARELLGPRPGRSTNQSELEIRTYGHIVVDEVQDLTPMQLRMIARRSLNGSLTVVGDIAQATGPFAPDDWSQVLAHLPDRRPARVVELTVGYRIPSQIMAMANRILRLAAPQAAPPEAVREGDGPPEVRRVGSDELGAGVAEAVARLRADLGDAGIAVLTPASLVEVVTAGLDSAGIEYGRASMRALEADVTVVPMALAKGLELDGVVLVEPARMVAEERQGLRALYVGLTRATKRLTVVHADPLPEALVDQS
jgi:DNA helicase IV